MSRTAESSSSTDEVTLAEAARRSGLSERTLRRWLKAGKLRCRKIAINYYLVEMANVPKPKRSTVADLRQELVEARAEIERLPRERDLLRNSLRSSLSGQPDRLELARSICESNQ